MVRRICRKGEKGCSEHADCINIPGNFTCTCIEGYFGDGFNCSGNFFKVMVLNHLYIDDNSCHFLLSSQHPRHFPLLTYSRLALSMSHIFPGPLPLHAHVFPRTHSTDYQPAVSCELYRFLFYVFLCFLFFGFMRYIMLALPQLFNAS